MNHDREEEEEPHRLWVPRRRPARRRATTNRMSFSGSFPSTRLLHLATVILLFSSNSNWSSSLSTTTKSLLVAAQTQETNSPPLSYACDESKCRGTRLHPWVDDDVEFTCWIAEDELAILNATSNATSNASSNNTTSSEKDLVLPEEYCADGYVGRVVEGVPPSTIETYPNGEVKTAVWYTCCRPDYPADAPVYQTCSDTACSSPDWEGGGNCWADGFQEPMSCDDPTFRYPRYTGLKSLIYIQFLCCDAPSQPGDDAYMDELLVARIVWMVLSGITFVICSVFIASILTCPKARIQGYNLYLVFLAIPDALANGMILVRNSLSITGVPVSPTVFVVLASFEYFYAASNMWLNGVIVRQIHRVLYKSRHFAKTSPPSVKKVCLQAASTYGIACIFFGWAMYLYLRGLVDFSLTAVVNIWITTRVIMVAPPFFYVAWVCFDVWRRKLLPQSGRTRVLSLYFLRVIIVFIVTWIPYFIIYEIAWNVTYSKWMVHGSYYLGSIQGSVSVFVALSKPDVKRAVVRFIMCRCRAPIDESVGGSRWGTNSNRSRPTSHSDRDRSGPFVAVKAKATSLGNRASTQASTVIASSRQFLTASVAATQGIIGRGSSEENAPSSDGEGHDGEDHTKSVCFDQSVEFGEEAKKPEGSDDVEATRSGADALGITQQSSQDNGNDNDDEIQRTNSRESQSSRMRASTRPARRRSVWDEDDVYHDDIRKAQKEVATAEETDQSSNDTKDAKNRNREDSTINK